MKQKSGPGKAPADQVLKDIRRQTRRQYSAEEKIRIVLEGLRGEKWLLHPASVTAAVATLWVISVRNAALRAVENERNRESALVPFKRVELKPYTANDGLPNLRGVSSTPGQAERIAQPVSVCQ